MQRELTPQFRVGKLEDLPAVKEVCKDVWGGNDYIPFVWKERLSEPNSKVFVVEIEQQLAGLYCLKAVNESGAKAGWWSGVRIATPFKRLGLAYRLLEHALNVAKQEGMYALCYSTGEDNIAMHRLAERFGFRLVASYSYATGQKSIIPLGESANITFRFLHPNELELAWDFIINSKEWQLDEGFHCDSWTWRKLELQDLQGKLAKNAVTGGFEKDNLKALSMFNCEEWENQHEIFVTWMGGDVQIQAQLAQYLAQNAIAKPVEYSLVMMLPTNPKLDEILEQTGFMLRFEDRMRLYELSLTVDKVRNRMV
ncbi:GNAT family N-acetyltransferase [Candidatus Chlorohelix sp.]|uniref:GNAT family N-acetyltransferase n=1 Tax=Candidatus Chlorohelix sp. TaxID=3139201 RepID=UPI003063BAFB